MKICVPSYRGGLDDYVCEHFGKAKSFTIYDTETGEVKIIRNTSEHFGGAGKPPELIRATGADAVICSGMGARAIALFKSFGIKVYMGASGTVKDAIDQFLAGKLVEADETMGCTYH
ncbi:MULTISPECIES: NifB/NifX family molybdenum-iron cluster-binding protein [unclassified Archaeoglobus]|jgi:predicted Fe-Mo cluster-binding NifX family protein|uniref:NifB/NifX family molybdenum-iron cluster-binding protein n=1 Tax=unclassified Archaeoglobus TaxID=2643606 RepID=UPI0025C0DF26|nr:MULTISPECIES: NifB/NifX family molybdenum-iron cluster-binding protein [unclassified Archaeoglobus]